MLKQLLFFLALVIPAITSSANHAIAGDSCEPYRQTPASASDENTKESGNIPYGNGLLWKITDPGQEKNVVRLFGTMHSQDRRVTDIPPPVRLQLVKSDIFVMEVQLDDEANRLFSEAIFSNHDQRLDKIIPADIYDLLAEKISDYGIAHEKLHLLQPWAAFTLVGRPRPVAAPTQDIKLMQMARAANLDITSLESMRQLLDTLEGLSMADQVEILKDTICNHSEILRQAEKLVGLYLDRDLAGIARLNDEPRHDEAVFNRFIERLLYDRNERMLGKIEKHIAGGNAFIAVGASHLPGERGLLKLLAEKGYKIERIY